MSASWFSIRDEHKRNVGFREGPNNQNPWGPEQGVKNAAYCDSASSMVPYHNGYRWWPDCTYGERGCAYTVSHVNNGKVHGEVRYDHASRGDPADVRAGDLLFYDWNGSGQPDHVETAIEDCPSNGRTHNVGYNTGSPGGCYDLWRDRKYLLCRLRPLRDGGYTFNAPAPQPQPQPQPQPGHVHDTPMVKFATGGPDPSRIHGAVRRPNGTWVWQSNYSQVFWEVRDIQQHAVKFGALRQNQVDGIGGNDTYNAVRALQQTWGLRMDAVVGPATWARLHG